jgi:CRP-like cAMP-binding protein
MHETLINYITQKINNPLSPSEEDAIRSSFKPRKLRRNQYFLQEGEVCKMSGFVVKGAMKRYSVDENGRENVIDLYIENWWAADRESFATEKPSLYFISAVEETELLVISRTDYLENLKNLDFVNHLTRELTEKQSYRLMKRVHSNLTLTAEQKLIDLEDTYPEFLLRFPQHLIASYLGMTKETLSRIRSQSRKK